MADPCHLQLHGLSVGDVCGACGHPAEAHRGHRAYVRDEALVERIRGVDGKTLEQFAEMASAVLRGADLSRWADELRRGGPIVPITEADESLAALDASWRNAFDRMHRRAQRAESETARVRREAIGQRKRADWWRARALDVIRAIGVGPSQWFALRDAISEAKRRAIALHDDSEGVVVLRTRVCAMERAAAAHSVELDELREAIRELRAERDEAIQERDRWIARVQSQERIVRRVREVVG